jgi:hypothetical protein
MSSPIDNASSEHFLVLIIKPYSELSDLAIHFRNAEVAIWQDYIGKEQPLVRKPTMPRRLGMAADLN